MLLCVQYLNKKFKDYDSKISNLDSEILNRVKSAEMKEKVKKTRTKLRKEMGDIENKANQRINEDEQQLVQ